MSDLVLFDTADGKWAMDADFVTEVYARGTVTTIRYYDGKSFQGVSTSENIDVVVARLNEARTSQPSEISENKPGLNREA